MQVYKCLHGTAPAYLEELCRPVSDIDGRRQLVEACWTYHESSCRHIEDVHSATPALPLGTLFLTIWRSALLLCLSSEPSLNIFFSHRTSTSSAFEVITETRYINYLLTYLLTSMFPDKQPLKLIQCCKTLWNSIYNMSEWLIALRRPVCAVLSEWNVVKQSDAKALEMKDEHWQLMEDLLPVLQPLQIATSVMSAETSPFASTLYVPKTTHFCGACLTTSWQRRMEMQRTSWTSTGWCVMPYGSYLPWTTWKRQPVTSLCVTATVLDTKFKTFEGITCFHNHFHSGLENGLEKT